nr:YceI family protein [uncultured Lichenicoccus sp.]
MKMSATAIRLPGLVALGALSIAQARAQAPAPATSDPARVESGSYAVEPNHTQVLFSVSHMGFSTFHGQFIQSSGSLSLDAKAPADSRFEIHVPVKSVLTSSAKLTDELKGDAWLDAKADPDIVFKSTKVTPVGHGAALVAGDLTLHGQTHPVTLHARLVGAGVNPLDKKYTVGFDLTGTLRRSEFGVKTYVPLIGDAVTLTVSGVFEKQG